MSLWVDKYRPNSLTKLDYHKAQALHLKNLVFLDTHFYAKYVGCMIFFVILLVAIECEKALLYYIKTVQAARQN
jgi:hypothetical protein